MNKDLAIETIEAGLTMMLAGLKQLRTGDEWVDQDHSPLGKRGHLRAVRDGKLAGHRPEGSRLVLVRREDLDRYLSTHRVRAKRIDEKTEAEDDDFDMSAALAFRAPPRRKRKQSSNA